MRPEEALRTSDPAWRADLCVAVENLEAAVEWSRGTSALERMVEAAKALGRAAGVAEAGGAPAAIVEAARELGTSVVLLGIGQRGELMEPEADIAAGAARLRDLGVWCATWRDGTPYWVDVTDGSTHRLS